MTVPVQVPGQRADLHVQGLHGSSATSAPDPVHFASPEGPQGPPLFFPAHAGVPPGTPGLSDSGAKVRAPRTGQGSSQPPTALDRASPRLVQDRAVRKCSGRRKAPGQGEGRINSPGKRRGSALPAAGSTAHPLRARMLCSQAVRGRTSRLFRKELLPVPLPHSPQPAPRTQLATSWSRCRPSSASIKPRRHKPAPCWPLRAPASRRPPTSVQLHGLSPGCLSEHLRGSRLPRGQGGVQGSTDLSRRLSRGSEFS